MKSNDQQTQDGSGTVADVGTTALLGSLQAVRMNDATVHQILRQGGTLEQCVIALANEKRALAKKVCDLELIAPKKMRFPDGFVRIYRAPEHLLPDPA